VFHCAILLASIMEFPYDLGELFPQSACLQGSHANEAVKVRVTQYIRYIGPHVRLLQVGPDMLPSGASRGMFTKDRLFVVQQRVSEVLDRMGEGSAAAQGLKAPITSGLKVSDKSVSFSHVENRLFFQCRTHEEHSVYLLLDREANDGLGAVVGMLKVGRKNLFLLDSSGQQRETYAMCVLDFYVHERRQR